MIRITKSIKVLRDQADVFEYVADFSNTAEWDPGITEAAHSSDGAVGEGSTFDLVASFRGNRVPMTYEITDYSPPRRVVLVGTGKAVKGVDEILFTRSNGGTRIDYQVDFEMRGFRKLFEPFMRGMFEKLSQEAMDGLEATLSNRNSG